MAKSRSSKRVLAQFGPALRAARKNAGLTLSDVASMTGSTPSSISEVERGTRSVTLHYAKALADAVGKSLNDLTVNENE